MIRSAIAFASASRDADASMRKSLGEKIALLISLSRDRLRLPSIG